MTRRIVLKDSPTTTLAQGVSLVFHPFLLGPMMFIYLPLQANLRGMNYWMVFITFAFFSLILPLLYLRILKSRGHIDELDVRDRKKRDTPYLVFVFTYFFQLCVLILLKSPAIILVYAIGYIINTAIYALINRYWKISIHGAGFGGPFGALLFLEGWFLLPFSLLVIPILWSRVKLGYHTPLQVFTGTILGAFLVYLEYSFLLPLISLP